MSFLAPLFLVGGAALALPVIFHLIRRTTREHTVFSSLMFLLPSPPRLSRRHRLQDILLLILRCLALALLALGFARPFLRQPAATDPTAAQPKRIVILVDVSASMRREGLWPAARERVQAVLRQAGPADHVAMFTFARQAEPLLPFDEWNRAAPGDRASLAMARLDARSPGWSATHLGNALVTAAEALAETDPKAPPGPRQIVLVSDLQTGSRLDTLQAYEWPKGVQLVVEPVKARGATNAGLQLVTDATDTVRAPDAPARVRVSNSADAKREQFKVGWTRPEGGEFVGATIDVYVPPGQNRIVLLPWPKDGPAVERIALRGDDDEFDNAVFVIPSAAQRLSLLWLGTDRADDTRSPLFFLRRALAGTPGFTVEVKSQAPSAPLLPDDVRAATAVFVAESLPPAAATALREQALAGKTVVFAPKSSDSAATLAALLGRDGLAMDEMKPASYAMFGEIDFQHPLFAPFADPRYSDFTKIHFWKYRKIDAASIPDARVIAKFDSGDPALVEVPAGQGRLYLWMSGWQPDDSQLAVSSKFVPLLWSLLETSGGVSAAPRQFYVGDRIPLRAGAGANAVRAPGGANVTLPAGATEFAQATQPGVYAVTGGERPQRFAVNLDANESRTAPLGPDELEHLGVPVAVPKTDAGPAPAERVMLQAVEAENRQKLWRWFIAATLAVLLVETALAGWSARRATLRTEEVTS
jgi:hypothetical protein